jgi:hypothetical protein
MTTAAPNLSDEQVAAIEFEAWQHVDGEFEPPTNDEWYREVNPTLVS